MNDYIKREDAQKITAEWLSGYINDDERNVIERIDVDLGELPPADVVEVVRCKDCKYQSRVWHEDKRFQDGGYYIVSCKRNCDPFVMHTVDGYDNDFCSYGERADT